MFSARVLFALHFPSTSPASELQHAGSPCSPHPKGGGLLLLPCLLLKALPKSKRQIMTCAGTGRNATESICIKRVSLPCWLLGVTEARILLGNGILQAGSIIPYICIKLPIKKIKQQKKCEFMFIATYTLASGNVCDRLFQKSAGGLRLLFSTTSIAMRGNATPRADTAQHPP